MGIEEFLLDRARKEGVSDKEIAFTKSLLTSTDFNVEKIAQLVGVTEDFVLTIKKDLGK